MINACRCRMTCTVALCSGGTGYKISAWRPDVVTVDGDFVSHFRQMTELSEMKSENEKCGGRVYGFL